MTEYHKSLVQVAAVTTALDGNGEALSPTEFVAYCARVSNPGNQHNTETAPKLLRYLVKNKHWSPFEMVTFTIEVHTSRAIGRQFLRHTSMRFQEFSQRYSAVDATVEPMLWEARLAGATNRQGSVEATDGGELQDWWDRRQIQVWETAWSIYCRALGEGIAPEVARAVLPEGMTPTTFYATNNLRGWIHYLDQRLDSHAQKEHRLLAEPIRAALVAVDPLLDELLPRFD